MQRFACCCILLKRSFLSFFSKIIRMKRLRYYFCIFCLLIGTSTIIAQKLTVGLATGPNFSNIRGDYQYGKWNSKMGTVSGLWVNYSPVPALSFGTEVNYISLFYQHINYTEYYNSPEYDIRMLPTILREQSWDLNFLRVPFYVKLSTPTRLRFDLLAGAYYAHLLSPKKDTYYSDSYPKNEFGWLVGAGCS